MISFRLLPSALAALSLLLGATPVHAYVTPDEFIEGNGGSSNPDAPVGDIDDFPLPDLGTPPDPTIRNVPLPKLIPLPDVTRPNPRARALVVPPAADVPAVPAPAWQSAEEERKALRGAHGSAPDMPHTAATPLAPSGLPLAAPLLMSALVAAATKLMRRTVANRGQ